MARKKQVYDKRRSQRIKKAREKKGMSRQQLSDNLVKLSSISDEYKNISCSISSVKSWEGIGRKYSPDNTTLKAISKILDVDFGWLLHGDLKDIIEKSMEILDNFNPDTEESISESISYPFVKQGKAECIIACMKSMGYSWDEINISDDFIEFVEPSIRSLQNSIELYITKNILQKT